MFTLTAVPVKFVGLLVLFTFTTLYESWRTARATGTQARISHGLHLAMSVLMLLMVPKGWWRPFESVVPLPVSIGLMALGTAWFVALALRATAGHRLHPAGCAAMFAAMTWHLTAMMVKMRAMTHAQPGHGQSHGRGHGAHGSAMASGMGTPVWWLDVIGLPLMAYLAWASGRAFMTAVRHPKRRLEALSDFAMNFGMLWMSTGLLVPLLPFFRYLAF